MTLKHHIGKKLIPVIPLNRHVFNHLRLELNSMLVRNLLPLNPRYRYKLWQLSIQKELLVNIGCGPFGRAGWINLDLFPYTQVTLRYDSRRELPLNSCSCKGIHVEHFFEHLSHIDEAPQFLLECHRCLEPKGILRIIVPDAELYVKAYLDQDWSLLNEITCGGDKPSAIFKTKIQALNHIFLQEWEHYGGYDAELLNLILYEAGFTTVTQYKWLEGKFPGGCIDREHHRPYSLYFEATK